ncbi:hypothetical protein B5F40_00720 [Gordonibacter sp. An230]|nr:hypothetical protein B5F40_00720 [Gordonibacter sp. An230]
MIARAMIAATPMAARGRRQGGDCVGRLVGCGRPVVRRRGRLSSNRRSCSFDEAFAVGLVAVELLAGAAPRELAPRSLRADLMGEGLDFEVRLECAAGVAAHRVDVARARRRGCASWPLSGVVRLF